MPELPEVETIKRELERSLKNKVISGVEILWPKTVAPTSPSNFTKIITGKKILGLDRRAKMILIHLNHNVSLLIHLKMTGQLIFVPNPSADRGKMITGGHPTADIQTPGKHTRLIFSFKDGSKLYFNDLRKFGWIRIIDKKLKQFLETEIGPDPLSKEFTLIVFKKILERYPNRTIKQILLDQKLIAGIGNIYADESAYLAHLLPMRKIKTLKEKDIASLYKNIIAVLKLSIKKKGTSSRNYLRSTGEPGGFVPHLSVYNRTGDPCKKCGTHVKKIRHAGRGTYYCPICQK